MQSRELVPHIIVQVMTDITPFQHPFRFGYLSLCHAQFITHNPQTPDLTDLNYNTQAKAPQDQLHKHAQTENKPLILWELHRKQHGDQHIEAE